MAISEIEEIQEEPTTTRSPEIQELPPETRKPRTKKPKPTPPTSSSSGCGGFSLRRRRAKKPEPDPGTACVGKTSGLSWATKFSVGIRPTMEDFHTTLRGFMRLSCGEFGGCAAPRDSDSHRQPVPIHYFGVFDGHRGDQVGEFCANMLHYMVIEEWEKQAEEAIDQWRERWKIAFSKAFERADDAVKDTSSLEPRFTGSTASVVLVTPCQIIASNCGDSRAILCRSKRVIPLTVDHKPHKKEEAKRIQKSGGKIIKRQGLRVEGVLSMTRAIGDHDLKSYVVSTPDMTYTLRSDDDECLIMASDGLWDVMSSEKVAKVATKKLLEYRSRLNSGSSPTPAAVVAEELVRRALAKNTTDNVTVIVVDLKPLWRTKQGSANNDIEGTSESPLQVS